GTKGSSSSAAKETPARRFGAKVVELHVLKWFNAQKEAKYAPENWFDEGFLTLDIFTSATRSASWDWDISLLSL
ncbi:hypothetical protein HAX54_051533, partial [Datura stramonium]|nr:hypothetical protein [Datura stramonium]